jgi:diguanylate cyclase (GGDEF)-like protein
MNKTTILVIEDEEPIRELIKDILCLEGFDVITASNGKDGLELAIFTLPNLILCDVTMPEFNGYEVLAELQKTFFTQTIPFIFLTARTSTENIRAGMNLGADDYLTKPFDENELLNAIYARLKKYAYLAEAYEQNNRRIEISAGGLNQQIYQDSLTNLPNQLSLRGTFEQVVTIFNKTLTLRNSKNLSIPIVLIGLDRFHRINTSLGYKWGNELLQESAQRLKKAMGKNSLIARLNTDEFVAILKPIYNIEEVEKIAQEVLQLFSQPFLLDDHEFFNSVSMGICCYPRDGLTLEDLMTNAHKTLAQVRNQGGNQYQIFSPAINTSFEESKLVLETDLRYALDKGEFQIYYQPQVDMATGKIVGAEALIRWLHPSRGFISPNIFIPLAEETGLIDNIGKWVIKTAWQQLKDWRSENLKNLRLSVNISARQFNQFDLYSWLYETLEELNIDPHSFNLDLELTERTVVENVSLAIQKINLIKSLGISISIDDFGTGYSSLSYLQQFSFDILKIDQVFVRNIHANPKNIAITSSIINMAHQLGLTVVAEGVENLEELEVLRQAGCNEIQGYLFSRPINALDFAELVKSGKLSLTDAQSVGVKNSQIPPPIGISLNKGGRGDRTQNLFNYNHTPLAMTLTIRAALPRDVAAIFSLIQALAAYEKLEHLVTGNTAALHTHLFGEKPVAEAIIAQWQEEIVGFALFFPNYSTFLTQPGIYIEDIFVLPAFRRQGIGEALLRSVAEIAQQRRAGRLAHRSLN